MFGVNMQVVIIPVPPMPYLTSPPRAKILKPLFFQAKPVVLCVFSRISNQQPRKLPAFLRSFEISKRFHCSSLKSAFDVRSLGASFWYKETWSKDWCLEVQKWVQERIVRKKSIYIYLYTVPVPNAHITRIHLFGPFGQTDSSSDWPWLLTRQEAFRLCDGCLVARLMDLVRDRRCALARYTVKKSTESPKMRMKGEMTIA